MATTLAVCLSLGGRAQDKGGEDETGVYNVVPNWLKPFPNNEGWTYGLMQGVFAESADRIYVLQGGELPSGSTAPARGGAAGRAGGAPAGAAPALRPVRPDPTRTTSRFISRLW